MHWRDRSSSLCANVANKGNRPGIFPEANHLDRAFTLPASIAGPLKGGYPWFCLTVGADVTEVYGLFFFVFDFRRNAGDGALTTTFTDHGMALGLLAQVTGNCVVVRTLS